MPVKELRTYLFIYLSLYYLQEISCFLLKRKKHIFKGLLFFLVVGAFLRGRLVFFFFEGRDRGRKFSEQEGEGTGTASPRGEVLSPCGTQRLQHRSKEVKFISHKSHVECLQGEVIKQMYEARGKVHPFPKTLPVSAALQKPREARIQRAQQKLS